MGIGTDSATAEIYDNAQSEPYKTIGSRFFASLFDSATVGIASSIFLLPFYYFQTPLGIAIYSILVFSLTYAYYVSMNYFFGGSLGKILMEIKIVDSRSGQRLTLLQAFLRESLGFLMTGIFLGFTIAQLYVPSPDALYRYFHPEQTTINSFNDIARLFSQNTGVAYLFLLVLFWGTAEFLVSIANRKRRALHDYIADTVVVKLGVEYRPWARLICIGSLFLNGAVQPLVNNLF